MAQILKFPAPTSKRGYRRARKCSRAADSPDQLQLFPPPTAQILQFIPQLSAFEQALMLDERGDGAAAEFYLKAIQEGDCLADAYCNLGIIESQRGNTAKAFDCFTLCLKANPRHSEAHYNLGNLYFDAHELRLAQLHYELAAELDPSFANIYFNLALVLAINNDLAGAEHAIARYQQLVSTEEGRDAEQFLQDLKKNLTSCQNLLLVSKRPEK